MSTEHTKSNVIFVFSMSNFIKKNIKNKSETKHFHGVIINILQFA